MTDFQLVSARELTEQALTCQDPAFLHSAREYARNKLDFLTSKGKGHRARLWRKALEALDDHMASLAPVTEQDNAKERWTDRDAYCKARGMVKTGCGGVSIWAWPAKNHKYSIPKHRACPYRMEAAYKDWKAGKERPFASVYL